MAYQALPLERLVEKFEMLPGIGHKTAQRLAFFVLSLSREQAEDFAKCMIDAHQKIKRCSVCQNLTDQEVCSVCGDARRNEGIICVVEDARDVMAFERTREFKGTYHVLHGLISPLDGIGPDKLCIKELLERIAKKDVREVILATNPTVEGEATAMYLSRLIKPFGIQVTRLAYGIPVGGDLEYADEMTLTRALEGRREF